MNVVVVTSKNSSIAVVIAIRPFVVCSMGQLNGWPVGGHSMFGSLIFDIK